jgi:hypothetical protein
MSKNIQKVNIISNSDYLKQNSYFFNYCKDLFQISTIELVLEAHPQTLPFTWDDYMDCIKNINISFHLITALFSCDLDFFINQNKYRIDDKKITILIDMGMFFSNVIFTPDLRIDLEPIHIELCNYTVMFNTKVIPEINNKFNINYSEQPVQQLECGEIKLENKYNKKDFEFSRLTKGFYLNGNINLITQFKILINGSIFIDYDKLMLNLIGVRISENMMYIPLEINVNPKDKSYPTYKSALDMARIEKTTIEINTDKPVDSIIKIYLLGINWIRNCQAIAFV